MPTRRNVAVAVSAVGLVLGLAVTPVSAGRAPVEDPPGDTVDVSTGEPLDGREAADIRGASVEGERLLIHMSQALGQILDPDENFSAAISVFALDSDRNPLRRWLAENHDDERTDEVQDPETGEPIEGETPDVTTEGDTLGFAVGAPILTDASFFAIEAFNTPNEGDEVGYDLMLVSIDDLLTTVGDDDVADDDLAEPAPVEETADTGDSGDSSALLVITLVVGVVAVIAFLLWLFGPWNWTRNGGKEDDDSVVDEISPPEVL